MSIIKSLENQIKEDIKSLGYDLDILTLAPSSRPEFGDYQINDAMSLGKKYGKNPRDIAEEIAKVLENNSSFTNVNIAGPGFINVTLTDEFLTQTVEKLKDIKQNNIDFCEKKKIIFDYGGANCAKVLHVGHLRGNIGEAVKRLAKALGNDVISDVHLGDFGAQAGLVCAEVQERYPKLICFKEDYNGEDFDLPFDEKALSDIYPHASQRAKEDEAFKKVAGDITLKIQNGHLGYKILWEKAKDLSLIDIQTIYNDLNFTFDLWEGEMSALKEIPTVLEAFDKQGLSYISDGALVVDVKEDDDAKEVPPAILKKSNGAYIYASTDLGTLYARERDYHPDEVWYFTDNRQELHFTQVFRAAKKAHIVSDDTNLEFLGFGTVNGTDGKPFKTRDGGVMTLNNLIKLTYDKVLEKTKQGQADNVEETAKTIAIAAIKYADLLSFRSTDYIFDIDKFCDVEGKTGPYLLYSTVRMKSLLRKAKEENIEYNTYSKCYTEIEKTIIKHLLQLPKVLTKCYQLRSVNEISEYIYKLTNSFNKFYAENKILIETDELKRNSWLTLTDIVLKTNLFLLNILAIDVPEKM